MGEIDTLLQNKMSGEGAGAEKQGLPEGNPMPEKSTMDLDAEDDSLSGDENTERGNWSGHLDFLLSALGYAVGLGNVWRFPYLCFKNGGGAFLIPYAIMLVFVGMPIFFFELSLGQYTSLGPMGAFSYSPFFQGIGFSMIIVSAMVCIYYNMIIAWSIHYLFSSFRSVLPWADCDRDWNTDLCYSRLPDTKCDGAPAVECFNTSTPGMFRTVQSNFAPNHTNGLCFKQKWNVMYSTSSASSLNCTFFETMANVTQCTVDYMNGTSIPSLDGMLGPSNTYSYDCSMVADANPKPVGVIDQKLAKEVGKIERAYPSKEYFNNRVLKKSDAIDDFGEMRWELVLSLLAAWLIVYFSLIKGVKSSGKVVYFTAIFPYVVLVILFFNGVLLEGAGTGVYFYLVPNFTKLGEAGVWKDATSQIFFSLSASWGGLITLASYNRFKNNVLRDTLIVTLGNCGTSFFAGFVIFSYVGNMAHTLGLKPADVADKGTGLAFVVYPHAVLSIAGSTFWAILFFTMLLTLGLDSQFTLLETVVTSIYDKFPKLRKYKYAVLGILCVVLFLLGLPLCTEAGEHILTLIDSTAGGWNIMVIGILETISISIVYGWHNFAEDIKLMTDVRPSLWWRFNWTIVTPGILVFVLIFGWVKYEGFENGDYKFPTWANGIGWLITMATLVPIVVYMVLTVIRSKGTTILERFKIAMTRSEDWGPALRQHRQLVTHLQPFKLERAPESTFGSDGWNLNPSSTAAIIQKEKSTSHV